MSDQKPWELDWSKPVASSAPAPNPTGGDQKPWELDWGATAAKPAAAPVALHGEKAAKEWAKETSDPGTQKPNGLGVSEEPTVFSEIAKPFQEGGDLGLSPETQGNVFGKPGDRSPLQSFNQSIRPIIEAPVAAAQIAGRGAEGLNRGAVQALLSVMPDYLIKQNGMDLPTSKDKLREDLNVMASLGEMLAATESPLSAKAIEAGVPPKLRPHAKQAYEAGYKLPPAMAAEKPGVVGSLMAGEGGKHKVWQAFSHLNQENTTNLAVKDLGLPEGTTLAPAAFNAVRKQVGDARGSIQQILPDLNTTGDFRTAIEGITQVPAELQQAFPALTKTNPKIAELQSDLLGQPTMSANNAIELTRRLRGDAQRNFKVQNDPDAHALAIAQIRASDAIEEMIENSIKSAPKNLAGNLREVNRQYDATIEELKQRRMLNRTQPTQEQHIRQMEKRLADLAKQKEDTLAKTRRVQDVADRDKILDDYRKARQLAAKSYDVEMATNAATGDVSAQRLSALRKIGRPLTGDLKKIADAYDAFPQALQNTQKFGGAPEEWSVLDTTLALQNLGSGHVGGAAMALARPALRRTLASPSYQRRLIAPNVESGGIKLDSIPSYVPVAGGVSMPDDKQ